MMKGQSDILVMDYNQDDLFPANLGGVQGLGRVEVKEAAFGDVETKGVFNFNTIDTWTLKEFFTSGTRCQYRGLWVQDGQQYIATVDVVIDEFTRGSSLMFRAVTTPSLKPI